MTAQQDPTEGHSPLPWEIGRDGQNVMSMHRLPVASSAGPVGAPHPNAALIVRAVNEHAALQDRVEELAQLAEQAFLSAWHSGWEAGDMGGPGDPSRRAEIAWLNWSHGQAALGQEGRDE